MSRSTVLSSLRMLGLVSASLLVTSAYASAQVQLQAQAQPLTQSQTPTPPTAETQSQPQAQVDISFKDPDNFSDLGESQWDRRNAMKQIEDHLKLQAGRELAGKQLKIQFTDIDLAGELEPRVSANRVRVLRTVTIPRMEFTYTLSENGKVLEEGKATINDMNYQSSTNRYFDSEPFRYEKKMLDDWMAKELLHKQRLARTGP